MVAQYKLKKLHKVSDSTLTTASS